MDGLSRPWMYHVWALLCAEVLLSLESVEFAIQGEGSDKGLQAVQNKCKVLLSTGLPRTLPYAPTLRLNILTLIHQKFSSYSNLLRCLTYYSIEVLYCHNVGWPEEDTIIQPAGHLLSRLNLRAPKIIRVSSCTAVSPFASSMITTRPYGPYVVPRQLYISTAQIDTVMGILRLLSDQCECRACEKSERKGTYDFRAFAGTYINDLPDPRTYMLICAGSRIRSHDIP